MNASKPDQERTRRLALRTNRVASLIGRLLWRLWAEARATPGWPVRASRVASVVGACSSDRDLLPSRTPSRCPSGSSPALTLFALYAPSGAPRGQCAKGGHPFGCTLGVHPGCAPWMCPEEGRDRGPPARRSARGQYVVADLVLLQVHQRAGQHPLLVHAAWVEAESPTQPARTLAFMNVAVQPEQRPEGLDRLEHRLTADGHQRSAGVGRPQVLRQLRGLVQAAPVRRHVKGEDGVGRILDLADDGFDPPAQRLVQLFAVGLPRRRIRPAGAGHLVMLVEGDDLPFDRVHRTRGGDGVVDFEDVVVSRADVTADARPIEAVVGIGHPALQRLQGLLLEELVRPTRRLRYLLYLFRGGEVGIVATILDGLDHPLDLVGPVQHLLLLEQGPFVLAAGLGDDRDDGLAGHVAAQDEELHVIELGGADEFLPTDFRPVDVGGEEEADQGWPFTRALRGEKVVSVGMKVELTASWCVRFRVAAPRADCP